MRKHHLTSPHALSSLARALSRTKDVSGVLEIIQKAEELIPDHPNSSLYIQNAAIHAFMTAQPPQLDEALALIHRMLENGPMPDAVIFSTVLNGLNVRRYEVVKSWGRAKRGAADEPWEEANQLPEPSEIRGVSNRWGVFRQLLILMRCARILLSFIFILF
jgi:hypothetical protein